MSELTKRLSDRLRIHYNLTADDIAEEAADRVEALEECLRECLKKGSRWHPCDPVVVKARALLEEK